MKIGCLVVVAIPLVEIVTTIYLAQNVGPAWAFWLALIGTAVATTVIVRNYTRGSSKDSATHPSNNLTQEEGRNYLVKQLVSTAVIFLLLIPGLVTDVVGMLLLLPVIRRKVELKIIADGEKVRREREAREKEAHEAT